jgi:hypothetical protein
MAVKTLSIQGISYLQVHIKGLGFAKARLIIRDRQGSSAWRGMNRYLYLVYRRGDKIKEHYIAKLTDEKI